MICLLAVTVALLPGSVPPPTVSRRAVLSGALAALPATAAHASKRADSPNDNGTGCSAGADDENVDRCNELAEGNEYILALQEKSRKNRKKNIDETYELNIRKLGYDEYLEGFDKALIQLPDQSYTTVDMETYAQMRKDGKIKVGAVDTIKQ